MDIHLTDEGLLQLLGQRIARLRLSKNLTQEQLAVQAGIGIRTLQRLERGETATQLSGFVRVCRVLGIVERFTALIPELPPSPISQLQLRGRQRQRATGRKAAAGETPAADRKSATGTKQKWTWGESS